MNEKMARAIRRAEGKHRRKLTRKQKSDLVQAFVSHRQRAFLRRNIEGIVTELLSR